MSDTAKHVILTIPMHPDMELAAAKTASVLAELMNFGEGEVEEIQLAIIETCINALSTAIAMIRRSILTFYLKMMSCSLKLQIGGWYLPRYTRWHPSTRKPRCTYRPT